MEFLANNPTLAIMMYCCLGHVVPLGVAYGLGRASRRYRLHVERVDEPANPYGDEV